MSRPWLFLDLDAVISPLPPRDAEDHEEKLAIPAVQKYGFELLSHTRDLMIQVEAISRPPGDRSFRPAGSGEETKLEPLSRSQSSGGRRSGERGKLLELVRVLRTARARLDGTIAVQEVAAISNPTPSFLPPAFTPLPPVQTGSPSGASA